MRTLPLLPLGLYPLFEHIFTEDLKFNLVAATPPAMKVDLD
jgi:hypothetical protein